MKNVKYLLLGGGYTLSGLAGQLNKDQFVITSRSSEKVSQFKEAGFKSEIADLNKIEQIKNLFSIYSGLEIVIDSIPPLDTEQTALKNYTEYLKTTNIKRIIYFSTTGVFGVTDGSFVNEKTSAKPNNSRSLARHTAENLYRATNKDFSAFRIAAIYGPGRGIGIALKNNTYKMLDNGERWSNRIHVDDIIETCKYSLSLNCEVKLPPVLCLSDNRPEQIKNIVDFYCNKYGYEQPLEVSNEEALKNAMHSIFSNQRVDNTLLRKFLCKELNYPTYVEGSENEKYLI